MSQPLQDTKEALAALHRAVEKALERKRRLGEYAVIWQDGKPVILGEEPPPPRSNAKE